MDGILALNVKNQENTQRAHPKSNMTRLFSTEDTTGLCYSWMNGVDSTPSFAFMFY